MYKEISSAVKFVIDFSVVKNDTHIIYYFIKCLRINQTSKTWIRYINHNLNQFSNYYPIICLHMTIVYNYMFIINFRWTDFESEHSSRHRDINKSM